MRMGVAEIEDRGSGMGMGVVAFVGDQTDPGLVEPTQRWRRANDGARCIVWEMMGTMEHRLGDGAEESWWVGWCRSKVEGGPEYGGW